MAFGQTTPTTINATDNLNTGRTVINSSLVNLYNSNVYNVKNYGAVGDYTGSGGGGTDDTAAIIAAIAAMPAGGGTLYFPTTGNGTGYKVTSTISISKNIRIVGDGKKSFRYYTMTLTPNFGASNIYYTDDNSALFSFGTGGATNRYPVVSIHDISLINAHATPVAGSTAIGVTDAISQGLVERVTIEGFYINVDITAGFGWTFDKVTFLAPVLYGLEWSNTTNTDIGWQRILNCDFIASITTGQHARAAIHMVSGGAIWIDNMDLNAAATLDTTSYFKYGAIIDIAAQTSEIIFSNSRITNYLLDGIVIKPNGVNPAEIQINNCQFAPQTDAAGPAIDIQGTSSNHIVAVAVTNITGQNTPITSAPLTRFAYIDGLRVDNIVQRAGNWTGGDVSISNCTNIGQPANFGISVSGAATGANTKVPVTINGTLKYIQLYDN